MNRPFCHVKKRALLAIAGSVWLAAGFNVARLGVLSYIRLDEISAVHILLSIAVFCVFGFMFYRMSVRHTNRIRSYPQETRPVCNFFDLKSYLIMDLRLKFLLQCSIRVLAAPWVPLAFCSG